MREIKFKYRIKHVPTGKLIVVIRNLDYLELYGPYPGENRVFPDYKILSRDQWTDALDKFKKDIYENDLIKITNIHFGNTKKERKQEPFMSEVKWHQGGFVYYDGIDPNCEPYGLYSQTQIIEIVGDIYNNPEILQQIQEARK